MTALGTVARAFDAAITRTGRRIADSAPRLEPMLVRARDRYARTYTAVSALANHVQYVAPADPYRLVDVDPAGIERVAGDARPMYRTAGAVTAGDWDRVEERFEDTDVYRAYEAHFERGVPWSETAFYERVVDQIESGRTRWGCDSRAAFDQRCERLEDLYEAIRTEGYYSQAALAAGRTDDPLDRTRDLLTEQLKHEVAVHVDRNGEFLFADGRNRLCIAKLLDLDTIPVRVLRRHEQWQEVRDAYALGAPALGDVSHPDLADLEFGAAGRNAPGNNPQSGRGD